MGVVMCHEREYMTWEGYVSWEEVHDMGEGT